MRNQRIALHLSDTDTTSLRTALDGLTSEVIDRAGGTDLELVVHHVTQTLVVHDADEDIGGELFAGNT